MNNLHEIISEIEEIGYYVIENFVDNIQDVRCEVEDILANVNDDSSYKFGKAFRLQPSEDTLKSYPSLKNLFLTPWFHSLAKQYLKKEQLYSEIFMTHEYRNDRGMEANGYLHFDKFSTFKYMIYLTDADETSGAFSCVPGTRIDGQFLRERAWAAGYEHKDIKNKPLLDYNDGCGYSIEDIKPICAPAGTLIIFDTDLFHLGGRIKENNERKLLRFHFHDGSRWS